MRFGRLGRLELEREPKLLGGGGLCTYKISDTSVAKFGWQYEFNPKLAAKIVRREFELLEDLYDNDVCVPKPLGVFNFSLRMTGKTFKRTRLAMVMEYVKGDLFGHIFRSCPINYYEGSAAEMRDIELEKARALGYIPSYDAMVNAILTPEGRVFLIDFSGWRMKDGKSV